MHLAHDGKAIAIGHADVGHNQRMWPSAEFRNRLIRRGGRFYPPAMPQETGFERAPHGGIVIYH
jgi:hypothetical protein